MQLIMSCVIHEKIQKDVYSRLSGDSEMVVGMNGDLLLLVKPHLYFPVHPSPSLYKFHHQMVSARFHVDIHAFCFLFFCV